MRKIAPGLNRTRKVAKIDMAQLFPVDPYTPTFNALELMLPSAQETMREFQESDHTHAGEVLTQDC